MVKLYQTLSNYAIAQKDPYLLAFWKLSTVENKKLKNKKLFCIMIEGSEKYKKDGRGKDNRTGKVKGLCHRLW